MTVRRPAGKTDESIPFATPQPSELLPDSAHHAHLCSCVWVGERVSEFFFVPTMWLMNGEINTYVVLVGAASEIHMQNDGKQGAAEEI